jgi:hypothetical protein
MGPVAGSYLYALAIAAVYGKQGQKNPHSPTLLPVDGRIMFFICSLSMLGLYFFVKYNIESRDRHPSEKDSSKEIELPNKRKTRKKLSTVEG